ncbi:unnamed protein product, partial [Pylaiella littoralis]
DEAGGSSAAEKDETMAVSPNPQPPAGGLGRQRQRKVEKAHEKALSTKAKKRVAGSIGRPPRPSAKPPTKSPRVAKKGPAKKKAALNKPGVDENGNPVDREKKFPRPLVEQEKIALLKSIEAVGGVEAYASKGCSETSYLWWETNILQGVIAALRDDETYHD